MHRLTLLLQRVAAAADSIRRDLPGWYPTNLCPLLDELGRLDPATCRLQDLDVLADRLTRTLATRDETRPLIQLAERPAANFKATRLTDLPADVDRPRRILNECKVLAAGILKKLSEKKEDEWQKD